MANKEVKSNITKTHQTKMMDAIDRLMKSSAESLYYNHGI